MKQIKITPAEREVLQQRFDVGRNYVQQVLSFAKNGPTAEKIRREALQMGGRYVDPDFVPNCRTQYISGMIVQTFGENVRLEICRENGNITLSKDGKVLDKMEHATMAIWNAMALKASSIAEAAMVSRK